MNEEGHTESTRKYNLAKAKEIKYHIKDSLLGIKRRKECVLGVSQGFEMRVRQRQDLATPLLPSAQQPQHQIFSTFSVFIKNSSAQNLSRRTNIIIFPTKSYATFPLLANNRTQLLTRGNCHWHSICVRVPVLEIMFPLS